MSNNPYAQVALTYIRRPFASWYTILLLGVLLFFLAMMIILMCFGAGRGRSPGNDVLPVLLCGQFPLCIVLFLFIVHHAKEQFSDSRAALTPDFRRVHAVVAIAAALLVAVVAPATITLVAGWRSVGLTAISVLMFGASLWLMVLNSTWIGLVMGAAWLGSFTEPGRLCLQELVAGHFEPQSMGLLILGLAITVRGGIRLFWLNEDMPEYHTRIRFDLSTQSYMNCQAWGGKNRILPGFWDWLAQRQMAALARHAGRAPLSRWSRICRWQIGMCTGWSVWLLAFGTIAYAQMLEWFFFSNLKGTIDHQPPSTFLLTFMLAFIPSTAAMGKWIIRCRSLGRELMLPVARVAYVRQLGLAAAASLFQVWGGMAIAAILWWQTLAAQPMRFDAAVRMLAVSALCQFWMFGVLAWFARYRSQGAYTLGMMGAMIPAQMLAAFSNEAMISVGFWAFPAAGVMAVLGLLITWDAYRRWLRADFA
jgi:hypothetical protein